MRGIHELLAECPDVFTDIPGTSDIAEHEIVLTSDKPVRSKPYPAPFSLKQDIKEGDRQYALNGQYRTIKLSLFFPGGDGQKAGRII